MKNKVSFISIAIIVLILLLRTYVVVKVQHANKGIQANPIHTTDLDLNLQDDLHLFTNVEGFTNFPRKSCEEAGPTAGKPKNERDFDHYLSAAMNSFAHSSQSDSKHLRPDYVLYTIANSVASTYNLSPLFQSLNRLESRLIDYLLVICVDEYSHNQCSNWHEPALCIFMNLGYYNTSVTEDLSWIKSYTYMKIYEYNLSVLGIDVDAIFFQDPFSDTDLLAGNLDKVVVVHGDRDFDLARNDGALVGAGFFYVPNFDDVNAKKVTSNILHKIWNLSCRSRMSTEAAITQILREYAVNGDVIQAVDDVSLRAKDNSKKLKLFVLPKTHYLSFCGNDCGSSRFREVVTFEDLQNLESELTGSKRFYYCEVSERRNWVWFHTACLKLPKEGTEMKALAARKGQVQRAVSHWVQLNDSTIYHKARNTSKVATELLNKFRHEQKKALRINSILPF